MVKLIVRVTDVVVGVVEAIGVGHNLQEDVHLVQDGSESGIFPVIGHNLGRVKGANLYPGPAQK